MNTLKKDIRTESSSGKIGTTMAMMGMGSVISTSIVMRQVTDMARSGSVFGGSNIRNSSSSMMSLGLPGSAMSGGDPGFSGGIVNFGGGNDDGLTSISTNAMGINSNNWSNTKRALSNIGGAVFGAAGMVAGPAGSAVMAGIGSKLVPGIAQMGRNVGFGIQNMASTIRQARNFTSIDGNSAGIKGVMSDIGQRRKFFGNLGEAIGSTVGAGALGRRVGHGLSAVSRQRLMATPSEYGGSAFLNSAGKVIAPSFQALQQQYPGAQMKFVQTASESSLWLQNPSTSEWSQVGLAGKADPFLRNGTARVIDYSLSPNQSGLQLQANGTYRFDQNIVNANGKIETHRAMGLQGSTPYVMRQSDAYLVGTNDATGSINSQLVSQVVQNASVQKFEDTSFKASAVNPDSYIAHHIQGADMRSTTDRVADTIHQLGQKIPGRQPSKMQQQQEQGWVENANIQKKSLRNKRIL